MHVVSGVAGNCDASLLDRMLILAMTAARANKSPSIILDQFYKVTNFHLVPCSILSRPTFSVGTFRLWM